LGHPKLDLENQNAVVIGGTSGIGLAIAKGLAMAGANVVATGRRADLVRRAASEIQAIGRSSLDVTCDVTDQASLTNLLAATSSAFGQVHILVNSAGRTKKTPALDITLEEWNAILETNLTGTLRACQVFGRHM
jgi:NAD(P)-dependent dehydrogenase (short-subunit alcohol dehydrogenase family)